MELSGSVERWARPARTARLPFLTGSGRDSGHGTISRMGPEPVDLERISPELYGQLKRLARARLAAGGRHVLLDTTSLVHESFLRLQGAGRLRIEDRNHFLAYAATAMRSVVIDFVRRRQSDKRGGGAEHITLNTDVAESLGASDEEILQVNDALESLGKVDARLVRVVEMRYFA